MMRTYPFSTFGLAIEGTYLVNFLEALKAHNPDEPEWDICDFDGTKIIDNKHEVWYQNLEVAEMFNIELDWLQLDEYCVYIPAEFEPSPFKAAYKNKEELINEFKNFLSEYLPSDFPWEKYIGDIKGSYIG